MYDLVIVDNYAIILVFLQIIASANDLVDYGERPDECGSRFLHRSYRCVKQGFSKRGKHAIAIENAENKYPQTLFGAMG